MQQESDNSEISRTLKQMESYEKCITLCESLAYEYRGNIVSPYEDAMKDDFAKHQIELLTDLVKQERIWSGEDLRKEIGKFIAEDGRGNATDTLKNNKQRIINCLSSSIENLGTKIDLNEATKIYMKALEYSEENDGLFGKDKNQEPVITQLHFCTRLYYSNLIKEGSAKKLPEFKRKYEILQHKANNLQRLNYNSKTPEASSSISSNVSTDINTITFKNTGDRIPRLGLAFGNEKSEAEKSKKTDDLADKLLASNLIHCFTRLKIANSRELESRLILKEGTTIENLEKIYTFFQAQGISMYSVDQKKEISTTQDFFSLTPIGQNHNQLQQNVDNLASSFSHSSSIKQSTTHQPQARRDGGNNYQH